MANYLRRVRTRIMYFQAIDVTFETILLIKQQILDEALTCRSPKSSKRKQNPINKDILGSLYDVISQYFRLCPTTQAGKLLLDVFIQSETWNEFTKSFAIACFEGKPREYAPNIIRYFKSIAIFFQRVVEQEEMNKKIMSQEMNATQKLWKSNIRKYLMYLHFLTNPQNGLLAKYLARRGAEFNLNFQLTKSILKLLVKLFQFNQRFSPFLGEEHSLFYIRMHYLHFLKLYTKPQKAKVQEPNRLNFTFTAISPERQKEISRLIIEPERGQIELCKLHLLCLFNIAKNRSEDISRKFFQFKILEFLAREMDLEYEISVRKEKFLELRKKEKKRFQNKMDQPSRAKQMPSSNRPTQLNYKQPTQGRVSGQSSPRGPLLAKFPPPQEESKTGNQSLEMENTQKKPFIPKLNTKGLGFSFLKGDDEVIQNNQKNELQSMKLPQIDKTNSQTFYDQEDTAPGPLKPVLQQIQQKQAPFKIPALKLGGLRPAMVGEDGEWQQEQTENIGNLTKLEQSLNKQNPKMQLALPNLKDKEVSGDFDQTEVFKDEDFYIKERLNREIYADDDLHVMIVSLVMCLLLTPTRGTLSELYCSQYPINNGKPNILFLLHHHLNHVQNKHLISGLYQYCQEIDPPLCGQRLLKLLSTQLFDVSLYKDWRKVAVGAYGTVYECKTGLEEPSIIAIKQMSVPKSIYDRCVLHDIFTEICCLEAFRLENCVTDLYDYGVTANDYYIVMKFYQKSLKD